MKRKKVNRRLLFLTLCGVFVTIIAMSVVYAALSTKLLIDGSAEVPNSSFGLKVEKADLNEIMDGYFLHMCSIHKGTCIDNYVLVGNGKVISEPNISGTSINGFKVSVEIPGDQVGIFYKVINDGTIPVKLIDVVENDYQIISKNNLVSDIELVESHFSLNSSIQHYDGSDMNINDILCPGESVFMLFYVEFDSSADSLPSGEVEISNISIAYDFVQADQYLCE